MVVPSQLEAGLRRYAAKPAPVYPVVYEDEQIVIKNMGIGLVQMNKKPRGHVLIYRRKL